ncbi:MAG: B-box zinc finger protein [Armatimonadota bacterium]|nr:B-box zinc finger protein [Armatimonadota bacterium]MDR7570156.1 B-box zinc finger protein [Armatimonadota bacterium]MDR7615241.1 B-box zinc finger protein [Armatimonadota bacterium]
MSEIRCAYHPDRPALYYCTRCGRAICPGCVVRTASGNLCRPCVEQPLRPRPRSLWAWVAAGAVLMVLLFWWFLLASR